MKSLLALCLCFYTSGLLASNFSHPSAHIVPSATNGQAHVWQIYQISLAPPQLASFSQLSFSTNISSQHADWAIINSTQGILMIDFQARVIGLVVKPMLDNSPASNAVAANTLTNSAGKDTTFALAAPEQEPFSSESQPYTLAPLGFLDLAAKNPAQMRF